MQRLFSHKKHFFMIKSKFYEISSLQINKCTLFHVIKEIIFSICQLVILMFH